MKRFYLGLLVALFSLNSFSTLPELPPLKVLLESCSNGKYECSLIDYYAGSAELTNSHAIDILAKDCNASHINSCLALGQLLLHEKKVEDSWEPLAKACFVNFNVACHLLRENKLPLPPYMSKKLNWGPSWPNEFELIDLSIITNQNLFRQCYEKRNFNESSFEVKIAVSKGRVNSLTPIFSSNNEFESCFTEKLKTIEFEGNTDSTIRRSFIYSSIYTKEK